MMFRMLLCAVCFSLSASVLVDPAAAEDAPSEQQVLVKVRIFETDKTEVDVVKLMLELAGGKNGQEEESLAFAYVVDTSSADKIAERLIALKKAKLVAEPKLVSVNGRPLTFHSGGEFPVISEVGKDANAAPVEFQTFGTTLTILAEIDGECIKLNLTPELSELLPYLAKNGAPAGVTTRKVNLITQLKSKQSIVISGKFAVNPLPQKKQIPMLGRLPNVSQIFRPKAVVNDSRYVFSVSAEPIRPTTKKTLTSVNLVKQASPFGVDTIDTAVESGRGFVSPAGYFPALKVQPGSPSLLQRITNAQPIAKESRLQSLRSALVHLQAAGLEQPATTVRNEIKKVVHAQTEQQLKQKTAQLIQLQSEISVLRQALDDE